MTDASSPPISRLLDIMAALRHPETGCPWDREQDFATIAPYTIEEAYEVAEAIRADDREGLLSELGDLLFACANLSRHLGFDPEEALRAANAKFERRFRRIERWLAERGRSPEDATIEELDALWERAKAEERTAAGADHDANGGG